MRKRREEKRREEKRRGREEKRREEKRREEKRRKEKKRKEKKRKEKKRKEKKRKEKKRKEKKRKEKKRKEKKRKEKKRKEKKRMFLQLPRPRLTCANNLTINLIQRRTSTTHTQMFLTLINDNDCATKHMPPHVFFFFQLSVRMRMITSQLKQIDPCPFFFAEIIDEGAKCCRSDWLCWCGRQLTTLLPWNRTDQPQRETELEGRAHTVQLLGKACIDSPNRETEEDDHTQLSSLFEGDDTTTKSCHKRKLLGLSTVADVQRNPSSMGRGQRRSLSNMKEVLATSYAAAQHLDSSLCPSLESNTPFRKT